MLNMTLKYLWLLNRVGLLDGKYSEIINKYEKQFHVPLDSYILRYVAKIENRGQSLPDNELKNIITMQGLSGSEWSKIDNYDTYKQYQEELREAIINNSYPLEWELEHWHKALKYCG